MYKRTPPLSRLLEGPEPPGPFRETRNRWGSFVHAYGCLLRHPLFIPPPHLFPIDNIPKNLHVLRPPVLVFEVIGMLPDIETKERNAAFRERRILVRSLHDGERPVRENEPRPPRSELPEGGVREGPAERGGIPERARERFCKGSRRFPAPVRTQDSPENIVVDDPAAATAHGGADPLRHKLQIRDELLDGFVLEFRSSDRRVRLVHVRPVVLAMVDLHRPGID